MKNVDDVLPILNLVMEGFAKHFGKNCEMLVHDYSKDFETTIVGIVNGEVTGRSIGKGGTNIGLRLLQGQEESDGKYNYATQTKDGRFLRSSTIYLKNDDGKAIGSLCINFDITDMINADNFIKRFINLESENTKVETVVFDNVDDLLIAMIKESIDYVGTPVALMNREQKMDGINYLSRKGALRIKNSNQVIAKYYDISKYTIYNYINESELNSK